MLDFTPAEKKTILLVVSIITCAGLVQVFRPYIVTPQHFDYAAQDSIFARLSDAETPRTEPDVQYIKINRLSGKPVQKKAPAPHSVDLNKADETELKRLPRIGPKMAQRIILFREMHGGFRKNEDLMKVKGIGKKTYQKIKPFLIGKK